MLYSILVFLLVIDALLLIGLILLQQGKGADAGAAFGSGSSGTVFGAAGSANFLSRATAVLAIIFFGLALSMAYFARHNTEAPKSLVEQAALPPAVPLPAVSTNTLLLKAVPTPAAVASTHPGH
jgi:preprotein translocase subunit SecG